MNKVAIIIVSLILATTVGLSGCNGASSVLLRQPQPEVVKTEATESIGTNDYAVVVTADIVNYGYSGEVQVTGHLWWGNDHWTESKTIYLSKDSHREVQLIFKGPSLSHVFSLSDYKYRVYVSP